MHREGAHRWRKGRAAVLEVYGLPFCEIHGAEVKAGALVEVYFDAEQFLDRFDAGHVPEPNAVAARALKAAVSELDRDVHALNDEDEAALQRAYPLRRELADEEILDYDYERSRGYQPPEDYYHRHRALLHKLMRLAHQEGVSYVVEALEPIREHVSAQLAYAMADYDERASARTD